MENAVDDIGFDVTAFEASLAESRRQRQLYRSEVRRSNEMACPGHHTAQDVREIWSLQDGKCHFCLQPLGSPGQGGAFVKDHLIPVRDVDGSHWPHNIALTCVRCNTEKHHRNERQYWGMLKTAVAADRYEALRQRAKELKRRKLPLTARRKKDRARGLQELEQAFQARIDELPGRASRHTSTPNVWIKEALFGTSIEIVVDHVALTLPGMRGGSEAAGRWFTRYGDTVIAAIAMLDQLNPTRRL